MERKKEGTSEKKEKSWNVELLFQNFACADFVREVREITKMCCFCPQNAYEP